MKTNVLIVISNGVEHVFRYKDMQTLLDSYSIVRLTTQTTPHRLMVGRQVADKLITIDCFEDLNNFEAPPPHRNIIRG